jgi:hypothetical protein
MSEIEIVKKNVRNVEIIDRKCNFNGLIFINDTMIKNWESSDFGSSHIREMCKYRWQELMQDYEIDLTNLSEDGREEFTSLFELEWTPSSGTDVVDSYITNFVRGLEETIFKKI